MKLSPGIVPLGKFVGIRRLFEEVVVEPDWEPWERLSARQLRRSCAAASSRRGLTINPQILQFQSLWLPSLKRLSQRRKNSDRLSTWSQTIMDPERSLSRLKIEDRAWVLKVHKNTGHPSAAQLRLFCQQIGVQPENLKPSMT